MALGIYLRKFFIENVEKQDYAIDTQSFGRFTIVADPEADPESLYPSKIIFEPTGLLSSVTSKPGYDKSTASAPLMTRQVDFARLSRLCRVQN